MNLMNLIKFVISWKQREQSKDFEVYTSDTPVVHLVIVVAVRQQTLRWPVPPGRNVLCEGWLRVYSSARAKVCQFDLIIFD